jgi:hypothetical protein
MELILKNRMEMGTLCMVAQYVYSISVSPLHKQSNSSSVRQTLAFGFVIQEYETVVATSNSDTEDYNSTNSECFRWCKC